MSKFYIKLLCIVFIFNSVVDCCTRKKETLPTTKPSTTEPHHVQPSVNITWKSHVLIVQRSLTELLKVPVVFLCSGTLINQHTILTTANCIHKKIERSGKSYSLEVNESHFTVYLGAHNTEFVWDESKIREPSVQERKVSKLITHHLYDSILNDVALFILDKKVEQNEHIKPAYLPHKGSNFPAHSKQACFVPRWGRTAEGDGRSNSLLSVKFEAFEPRYCSDLPYFDDKSQLCVGEIEGGENTCKEIAGSGLYAFDKSLQNYVTIGIVSYGYDCEKENTLNAFTRTSYYIDWIHHNWM